MDDVVVSAANLQLAPVFWLAALVLTLGLRFTADRRRSLRSAGADDFADDLTPDRGARAPG